METASAAFLVALLVVIAQLRLGLSFSSTAPAFLWSPHLDGKKEMVDYRILAPRDLAKSAMTEGGWSKYLCSRENAQQYANFAFLFIGTEVHSQEISRPSKTDPALIDLLKDSFTNSKSSFAFPYVVAGDDKVSIESSLISKTDPALIDLLKDSFTNSNSSFAFPYVVAGDDKVSIESSLISEFADTCQQNSSIKIALVGSCTVDSENFDKLNDAHSVHDYLNSRIENVSDRHTDLIVVCPGGSVSSQDSDQPRSESSILSHLLNTVNQLGAKYSVLYISDPSRSIEHLSRRGVERFLAEGTVGNESVKATLCDGVCQIKSTLLEGILVGIVLLVILISGLCCMMGIDTPTRFETPQDS